MKNTHLSAIATAVGLAGRLQAKRYNTNSRWQPVTTKHQTNLKRLQDSSKTRLTEVDKLVETHKKAIDEYGTADKENPRRAQKTD